MNKRRQHPPQPEGEVGIFGGIEGGLIDRNGVECLLLLPLPIKSLIGCIR